MRVLAITLSAAFALSLGSAHAMSPSSAAPKSVYGPVVSYTRNDAALPATYKGPTADRKKSGVEPLRGPWRVTKSLKKKGKVPADENGNTYACVDQACKVSRRVDEPRD